MLDVATHLLLVDVERDEEIGRRNVDIEGILLTTKARQILAFGVETLICGAVSRPLEAMLASAGVRVIPQMCGAVEDVLRAFLCGRLTDEAFLMPGCCGRHRWRRGRSSGGRAASGSGRGSRERGGYSTGGQRGGEA